MISISEPFDLVKPVVWELRTQSRQARGAESKRFRPQGVWDWLVGWLVGQTWIKSPPIDSNERRKLLNNYSNRGPACSANHRRITRSICMTNTLGGHIHLPCPSAKIRHSHTCGFCSFKLSDNYGAKMVNSVTLSLTQIWGGFNFGNQIHYLLSLYIHLGYNDFVNSILLNI